MVAISGRLLIPKRFLCPKCHGQRMTCCSSCGGNGKLSIAGITSATVRNATEPAKVVAMFVAALVKSKRSNRRIQTIMLVSHDR